MDRFGEVFYVCDMVEKSDVRKKQPVKLGKAELGEESVSYIPVLEVISITDPD